MTKLKTILEVQGTISNKSSKSKKIDKNLLEDVRSLCDLVITRKAENSAAVLLAARIVQNLQEYKF
jgi:hypothetical protein